jgi:short-subunit dehydrogenase
MAKKAMITGASSGIGRAFAERLAKDGFELTLVARSDAKLKELAGALGKTHRVLRADLSVPADIQTVAADVRASGYDLLINNAGVAVYGRFAETDLEKHLAMMRLNMDAVVVLAHTFLQGAKKGDALLNVASTLALLAFPGATTYCASKAFVSAFSESLWWEMKDKDVYVAGLLPGVTKTNFHEASGGDGKNPPPENMSQTAEQVVEAAMVGLRRRGSPTIISGFNNRAMIFATRFMPRKSIVNMMGGFGPAAPRPEA